MDTEDPGVRAAYDKDQAFDLEVGMAVYDPDGTMIGSVTAVEGFGSTRLGTLPESGRDNRVTQARGGTGYFKVKRTESAVDAADVVIPFSGIEGVTADHGVILSRAVAPEPSATVPTPEPAAQKRRGFWAKLRSK